MSGPFHLEPMPFFVYILQNENSGRYLGLVIVGQERLFETFIAAFHKNADQIDDSSGDFGMLVENLFRNWIKVCQAANHGPDEIAKSLLSWMEDDPY